MAGNMPGGVSEIFVRAGGAMAQVLKKGDGPPLVYLHGGLGFNLWSPFLDLVAGEFTVYAPVLPGLGKSEAVDGMDDILDLTLYHQDLLDALDLGTPHVVGHYFGAMIAAEMSVLCPHRVNRLVLSSPAGMWRDKDPGVDFFATPVGDQRAVLFSDPESDLARTAYPEPNSEDERAEESIERVRALTVLTRFLWPIPDKGLKKRLYRVKSPTLVLVAEHDRIVPPGYGDDFTALLQDSTLRVIPGAGHLSMLEKPAESADAVTSFLKSQR